MGPTRSSATAGPVKWDTGDSKPKLEALGELVSQIGRGSILLLCHNNPDPDALAGATGLQFLLKKAFGVRSVIGYGGLVTRAENQAMVHRLKIAIKRITRLNPANYHGIALMDAQPGTGNNLITTRHDPPLIVIDHHPPRKMSFRSPFHDIRPHYGATSTIVSEYIAAAGLTPTKQVANALLYGIKTDTHSLLRGASKPDFCAFNFLSPYTNPRVIGWIENPSLPQTYFSDYHRGLSNTKLYRDVAVSYLYDVSSEAIIPELADMLLRIATIRWSLCIGKHAGSLVFSLRSSSRKLMAGNVLLKIIGKAGSAGGHKEMAGGQMRLENASDVEAEAIAFRLIKDFLELMGRGGVNGKPLVTECARPERPPEEVFRFSG